MEQTTLELNTDAEETAASPEYPIYNKHDFFGFGNLISSNKLDEAIKQAKLDFTVSQHDFMTVGREYLYEEDGSPMLDSVGNHMFEPIEITQTDPTTFQTAKASPYSGLKFPSLCPIVRDDTHEVIGMMGKGYTIIQNEQCMNILEDLFKEEPRMKLVRGGHFRNCERLFIIAELPDPIVVGKDRIEKYIMILWSHTGAASVVVRFLPSLQSWQGLNTFLHSEAEIKVRHTKNGHIRMEEAQEILLKAKKFFDNIGNVYKRLADTPFDDTAMSTYLDILFPEKDEETDRQKTIRTNRRSSIIETWKKLVGGTTNPTALDAVKVMADYGQTRTVRKTGGVTEGEARLSSIWFGNSGKDFGKQTKTLIEKVKEKNG